MGPPGGPIFWDRNHLRLQKADAPSFSSKQSSHQTKRNNKKLLSTGFQQPIAPRLPQQETKSSTKQLAPMDPILGPENLLKTGFAQKGLPSCPSGRHKPQSFIETKRCASATLIQKTSKNEPKHGPKNGPIFWDRMHSLVKEQKKSTFTVPFLGPSGGTKKETAKSQNQQQRPTRATNKK